MKRSSQIGVIILGGAVGVGSLAYLASPSDRCRTDPAYEALHASDRANRSGSGSSGGRSYFGAHGAGGDATSASSSASGAAASTSVERGGFGSFMRSVSSHFSSGS